MDPSDEPCLEAEIAETRQRVGDRLLLQVTTEAVGIYSPTEQIEVVRELVPEAVSLSVRELAAAGDNVIAEFDRWMRDTAVLPQWILYSVEELALLDDSTRSASVRTVEKCSFCIIYKEDFNRVLDEHPNIARHLIRNLAQRVRKLTADVKSLALQDVYGRVVSIRKNSLTARVTLYGITNNVVLKLEKLEAK